MTKTLDDFRAKHDPTYVIQTPQTVLRRDLPPGTRRFIFTAAQNATPVHPDAFACMKTAARDLKAELLVGPLRYKNPTSSFSGSQQNAEWWAPETVPYLWNQRYKVNDNLVFLADIKTQPTAVDPLAGMDGISGEFSGIFLHTKLRLRSVPTPQSKLAKVLTTTGACTVENYTDTRAGKVGEFHHVLAAVLVELEPDGKRFHLRQLMYSKSGKRIIDLDRAYYADRAAAAPPALAVVFGDTHVDFLDPMVDDARHRVGGLIDTVRPANLVEHDLLDAYSCNPHHKGNRLIALAKAKAGRTSIEAEVGRVGDYLRRVVNRHAHKSSTKFKVHVIPSNHNDMLARTVLAFIDGGMSAIPHVSVDNLEFLCDTARVMAAGATLGEAGTRFPEALSIHLRRMSLGPRVHVMDSGESLMIGDNECGMHGDDGPNGARGSVRNLARIGVKSNTGHGHGEEIFEGHWRVGTGTRLYAEYTHGPGSWTNTDLVLNADSKRQLLKHIADDDGVGHFRA